MKLLVPTKFANIIASYVLLSIATDICLVCFWVPVWVPVNIVVTCAVRFSSFLSGLVMAIYQVCDGADR